MLNILVLGISGNVSQGILKALKQSAIDCRIIGACVNIDTVGALWCDKVYESPYANTDSFIPWVVEVCNRENIDILFTGVEENLLAISKSIDYLRSFTKTVFIVSEYEKLLIGQNKFLTCEWLKNNKLSYPKYITSSNLKDLLEFVDEVGYPIVAKPQNGKGSKGVILVSDFSKLKKLVGLESYIFQQCVGNSDSEYTVGCYMDKHGKVMKPIIMHRWLQNGSTWKAEVVENKPIEEDCFKICEAFKPMGPMNIQLRLDSNGTPVPFELNVRFSGTTPLRSNFGFRDVEASINEYLYDISIESCFDVKRGFAYRYVNEVYDFSDNNLSPKKYQIDKTLEG